MRKLMFLLVTVSMLYSCGKEQIGTESVATSSETSISTRSISPESLTQGIEVTDGMLAFKSIQHVEEVAAGLADLVEAYDDAFLETYKDLSDEELEDLEDEIGYTEHEPLIEFEKILNFESRRSIVEPLIELWLQNDELDYENDPDAIDGNSTAMRTLLNGEGKLMSGGRVLDFNLKAAGGSCWPAISHIEYEPYSNGNRKYKLKVAANGQSGLSYIRTQVCNYKKRSIFSGWKQTRTNLKAHVEGVFRKNNCSVKSQKSKSNNSTKKKKCRDISIYSLGSRKFSNWEPCGSAEINNSEVEPDICLQGN